MRLLRTAGWLLLGMGASCGSNLMGPDGGSAGSSGSGSGGSSSTGSAGTGGNVCLPDLTVPWQIVQNIAGDPPLTCAQVPAARLELDVNGVTFPQTCPANASRGQFFVPLAASGSYVLDVFLLASNDTVLSEAHPPTITVGCVDLTTPTVVLPVN